MTQPDDTPMVSVPRERPHEVEDDHLPLMEALTLLSGATDMAVYASEGSANVAWTAQLALAALAASPPLAEGGREQLIAAVKKAHGDLNLVDPAWVDADANAAHVADAILALLQGN